MNEKVKKHKTTLRNVILSSLVIFAIIGVITIYYVMLYSETNENITKDCELSSTTSADQIDKYLSKGSETIKLVSYTLDEMIRSGKSQEDIHDFLVNQSIATLNSNSGNETGIYGYIRGEYLDGVNWVPDADYVPIERPWYIVARANVGRVAVVDPYIDAMTGVVTITLCKTLCDAKSVVSMDFSMAMLQEITEDIVTNSQVDMEMVIDQNYQVIAHSDSSELSKNYLTESDSFGHELVEQIRKLGTGVFSLKYDGSNYIIYVSTVANDWYCISIFDATNEFSSLIKTLVFTIIFSIAVVICILLFMINSNRKQESYARLSNVVEALAAAIDAKDAYTNGHSSRVAAYAREISRRHGDSDTVQQEIYMMGLLHDVGKIGIPDEVINKPGKLTDEEYNLIKRHPDIGYRILSKAAGMPELTVGIRWHHERYDGKGYPDGLSGKEIPEKARIIAVADAYDAMTSKRSYRDFLDQSIVRNEIVKGIGTQFDPEFAYIMIKMIDEDKEYNMKGV